MPKRKYAKSAVDPTTGRILEEVTEWTLDDYLEEIMKRLEAIEAKLPK
jgi:hypothetical protein